MNNEITELLEKLLKFEHNKSVKNIFRSFIISDMKLSDEKNNLRNYYNHEDHLSKEEYIEMIETRFLDDICNVLETEQNEIILSIEYDTDINTSEYREIESIISKLKSELEE